MARLELALDTTTYDPPANREMMLNHFIQPRNHHPSIKDFVLLSQPIQPPAGNTPTQLKFNMPMCPDSAARPFCPRGNACIFMHIDDDYYRVQNIPGDSQNSNYGYAPMAGVPMGGLAQMQLSPYVNRYSLAPWPQHNQIQVDNYNMQNMPPTALMPPRELTPNAENHRHDEIPSTSYGPMESRNQMGMMLPIAFEQLYQNTTPRNISFSRPEYPPPSYPCGGMQYHPDSIPVPNNSPTPSEERSMEVQGDFSADPFNYGCAASKSSVDSSCSPYNDVFNFGEMSNVIQSVIADDKKLTLEHRIDMEFESSD